MPSRVTGGDGFPNSPFTRARTRRRAYNGTYDKPVTTRHRPERIEIPEPVDPAWLREAIGIALARRRFWLADLRWQIMKAPELAGDAQAKIAIIKAEQDRLRTMRVMLRPGFFCVTPGELPYIAGRLARQMIADLIDVD